MSTCQIFLSYAHADEGLVREIAAGLEAAGYTPWHYQTGNVVGSSYVDQILSAIDQSAAAVLILSPQSVGSRQVQAEIEYLYEQHVPVIPLLVGLSHEEFQKQRRDWAFMLGTAVTLVIPPQGVEAILPQVLRGLERQRVVSERGEHARPAAPPPSRLPIQPTSFIGREREVGEVTTLLRREDIRLLTLTGPGGTGKTRLALQIGAQMLSTFPSGVFFVDLAPLADPALVPSTIAASLGLQETAGLPIVEALKQDLRDKQLLLVLDNFEHVLDACSVVGELLAACLKLTILTTSREVLRLAAEHEYPVPPLALPDPTHLPPLDALSQYDAVVLFIQRAEAVRPGFRVTNETAPAVAEICHRLDGLPLAIELAAARIRLFPPQALLQRLSNRLKLLTGGARDLPARQQTLRGAIEWSYSLLSPEEQTLFTRLSVFAGGCTIEAAEAVCNAEGDLEMDTLDGITSLVEKSLLRQEGEEEPRFSMLETIREYASERMDASGEGEQVRHLHAQYFLRLVEEAEPQLMGRQQAEWRLRLEAEHDNIRVAIGRALERGEGEVALRLTGPLWFFWYTHGHSAEGCHWLERALQQTQSIRTSARVKGLLGVGALQLYQGRVDQARDLLHASLKLAEELGDKHGIAESLLTLGVTEHNDARRASALAEQSLGLFRELEDRVGIRKALNNLGVVAQMLGDYERAKTFAEEHLALSREDGDIWGIAGSSSNLASALLDLGDSERAKELCRESLILCRQMDDRAGYHHLLAQLAGVAAAEGRPERAARLAAAAEAARDEAGLALLPTEQSQYDRYVAPARAQLDQATWDAIWQQGRAMTLEQAIDYALSNDEQEGETPAGSEST